MHSVNHLAILFINFHNYPAFLYLLYSIFLVTTGSSLDRLPDSFTYSALFILSQRLSIAKEFGDKAAERRAYTNLGNAHIFLGDFELAAEYYK